MAHVENTVMDVYYRNDSMKSAGTVSALIRREVQAAQYGWLGDTHKVA